MKLQIFVLVVALIFRTFVDSNFIGKFQNSLKLFIFDENTFQDLHALL
jgi:hypothetical protein